MPKPITDLSERELKSFIKNYEDNERSDGGIFPLSDLLVERLRRVPTSRSPKDILAHIVEAAASSDDGKTTYHDVWNFLHPGEPWKGNHSIRIVGGALGTVIAYSVQNRLPIVSSLVVQSGNRKLSDRAIQNIFDESKKLGVNVGVIPADFVASETVRARELNVADLP